MKLDTDFHKGNIGAALARFDVMARTESDRRLVENARISLNV